MYSCADTAYAVGCPIRISTDQRLLAAPRGFSQRATSFIASWCQGIHRMPFLYSISRFGPSGPNLTMHRNHPQGMEDSCWKYCVFRTQHDLPRWPPRHLLAQPPQDPTGKIVHRASEPSPSNRWGAVLANNSPGQTSRLNNGTLIPSEDRPRITRAQRRTRT
jgi:hypothetical protein